MKFTCIINNFNYAKYLADAVYSASQQIISFDEIIVVDDCSTDGSRDVIAQLLIEFPRLKIVLHDFNQGQAAALETGIREASGDVVCFLDADDVYSPTYLLATSEMYSNGSAGDFMVCEASEFAGTIDFEEITDARAIRTTCLGRSAIRTRYGTPTPYVGASTSRISMRRSVADALFPIPWLGAWKICADDCLVYGSSLLGVRKSWLPLKLVGYRVHGENSYYGNRSMQSMDEMFRRQFSRRTLIAFYANRFGLTDEVARLSYLEFRTLPCPSLADLLAYVGITVRFGAPSGVSRLRALAVMAKHWLRNGTF